MFSAASALRAKDKADIIFMIRIILFINFFFSMDITKPV